MLKPTERIAQSIENLPGDENWVVIACIDGTQIQVRKHHIYWEENNKGTVSIKNWMEIPESSLPFVTISSKVENLTALKKELGIPVAEDFEDQKESEVYKQRHLFEPFHGGQVFVVDPNTTEGTVYYCGQITSLQINLNLLDVNFEWIFRVPKSDLLDPGSPIVPNEAPWTILDIYSSGLTLEGVVIESSDERILLTETSGTTWTFWHPDQPVLNQSVIDRTTGSKD